MHLEQDAAGALQKMKLSSATDSQIGITNQLD